MMRPPSFATGTFRKPISWKPGATFVRLDGTVTIQQPLIAPLYQGRSAHEVLAGFWVSRTGPVWRSCGITGSGSRFPATSIPSGSRRCARDPSRHGTTARPVDSQAQTTPPSSHGPSRRRIGGLELVFRPDHDLGWPIRQQRVAPGIAQAVLPTHVG